MLPGPVLPFELIALARRKRYFLLRFAYGLLLLWIVWANYPGEPEFDAPGGGTRSIREVADIGRWIFSSVATAQSGAVLLLTPALVAGVIADEKQRKTLHYLLASCLSSAEIVLGKLGSRLISGAVYLFLSLPVLAMLGFLGGVDPNDVVLLFLGSGSTMFLLAGFSMAVSIQSRRPREAVSTAYLAELVWLFGPTLIKHLVPWSLINSASLVEVVRDANDWVGATSPFFLIFDSAMMFRTPGQWYDAVFRMIWIQLLFGTFFTAMAIVRLRPAYRADDGGPRRFSLAALGGKRRLLPRPKCGNDPILWKELFVAKRGWLAKAFTLVLAVGLTAVIGYWTIDFAVAALDEILRDGYLASVGGPAHQNLNFFVRSVSTFLLICWEIGVAALAAGALSVEREEDTWVSLIATPLTPFQIVRAKFLGTLWGTWGIALLWLLPTLTGLVCGAVHPVGFLSGVVVTATYVAFACALGLFYSLRARTSTRALTATIATLAVCNGPYLIVFAAFDFRTTFPLLGVTPFVGWLSFLSYPDVDFVVRDVFLQSQDWRAVDLLLTSVASVLVYGLLAWLMLYDLVADFDDVIDRPRTFGGRKGGPYAGRGPGRAEPAEAVAESEAR